MENRISVTCFFLNKNKDDKVVANLGLKINSMDLFFGYVKLVKKTDGTFYVAPPCQEKICYKTGKKLYKNYWWFGSRTSSFFQKESIKAINDYCEKNNIENPMRIENG